METVDVFSSLAELLAEMQADELEVKHGLLVPRNQYIEEKIGSIKQELEGHYAKILRSMSSIAVILKKELELLPQIVKEHHAKELSFAMQRLIVCKKNPEELAKEEKVLEANTWQDFFNLSDETLLWIYKIGYRYHEERKTEEARALFQLLVMLNSQVSDYWVALGFTERQLSLESVALTSFAMAIILNPENPIPRYQSAELYFHLGQFEDALLELDVLSEIIAKEKLDFLKSDVELLRSKVKNKQLL